LAYCHPFLSRPTSRRCQRKLTSTQLTPSRTDRSQTYIRLSKLLERLVARQIHSLFDVIKSSAEVEECLPSSTLNRDGSFKRSGWRTTCSGKWWPCVTVRSFWHGRSRGAPTSSCGVVRYQRHCSQLVYIIPEWSPAVRSKRIYCCAVWSPTWVNLWSNPFPDLVNINLRELLRRLRIETYLKDARANR